MPITSQARKETQVSIAQGAAGSTDLVAAPGAGLKVHVTAMCLSIGTTGTVQFTEGTGPTALTGAMNLTAGNVIVMNSGGGQPVISTQTANSKLTLTSVTGAVKGWIRYYLSEES